MDPLLCCLAGICCPPLVRRQKMIAHYQEMGFDLPQSEKLATDIILLVDALMAKSPAALLKAAAAHKDKQ
jgi:hypothetical protein